MNHIVLSGRLVRDPIEYPGGSYNFHIVYRGDKADGSEPGHKSLRILCFTTDPAASNLVRNQEVVIGGSLRTDGQKIYIDVIKLEPGPIPAAKRKSKFMRKYL